MVLVCVDILSIAWRQVVSKTGRDTSPLLSQIHYDLDFVSIICIIGRPSIFYRVDRDALPGSVVS